MDNVLNFLKNTNNNNCDVILMENTCAVKVNVDIGNADRVKFAISPYELIVMHSWSLTDKTPNKYTEWNDQKVYAFIYKRGLPDRQNNSFEFQITLQVPNNYYGKLVRVSVESEFISSITFTKDYEDTLNMFPEWTDVAAWNAFYEEMVVSVL